MPNGVEKVVAIIVSAAALTGLLLRFIFKDVETSPAAAPVQVRAPSTKELAANLSPDLSPQSHTANQQAGAHNEPSKRAPVPQDPVPNYPNAETPGRELAMAVTASRPGTWPPAAVMSALSNASIIRCDFGAGGGANWSGGTARIHSAAWQGGPITFQLVEMSSGRALMAGSAGATGSQAGETEVRASVTNTGLHFSGITAKGEVMVTSIFGALDSANRYLAVMSRHGTQLNHESAQFYGTCDAGLPTGMTHSSGSPGSAPEVP